MKKNSRFCGVFLALSIILSFNLLACSPAAPPPTGTPASQQQQKPATSVSPTAAPQVQAPSGIKATTSSKVEYLAAVPMTQAISAKAEPVQAGKEINVPVITWGGDVATIYANGNSVTTQPGSIFAQEGLALKLFREDNFVRATDDVISGQTPYLRGTNDMINSALEALASRGIEMVVIYQLTWSSGGDTITVRSDQIATPADLKGKNIGVQLYGPHPLYLATVLRDAGLKPSDVHVKWLRELTVPPYDTKGVAVDPMTAMQQDPTLAAVTVISPDMQELTSGGNVGTGAENSVKGAKLLLSTKTAGHVIADEYAVRKDYLDAHRAEVQSFVHGLLVGQEQLTDLYNNHAQRAQDYQTMLTASAQILRDSPQATADVEGLLQSCEFVGYRGNVQFFTGQGTLRTFDVLTKEAQDALIGFGLMAKPVALAQANWDYTALAHGLKDTTGVTVTPRFDQAAANQITQNREQAGATQGTLFSFEINFQPNQDSFPADAYTDQFQKVLQLAATYPGALIIVEGHADPSQYNNLTQNKAQQAVLDKTKQAAKNLSLQRAIAVRQSLIGFAKSKNLALDESQFTVAGVGIDNPKYPNPSNETEWKANMVVRFEVIQVEAETSSFSPSPAGK